MRFISADTIVPDPVSPQQFNRFSFVTNNPLKYIDPTGHCGEGSTPREGVSQQHHDLLCTLHDEALRLSELVKTGDLTDVEALAMLMEFAAPFYSHSIEAYGTEAYEDTGGFIYDLGIVVGGLEVNPPTEWLPSVIEQFYAHGGLPTLEELQAMASYQMGWEPNDPRSVFGQYYVGIGAFGTTGFASTFREAGSNQVRHFLGSLAGATAYFGVGRERMLILDQDNPPDYNLHLKAFELADHLNVNTASDWVIANLASWEVRRKYGMAPGGY